jgi:adenine-specific DNA glycosylase
MLQQTQVERTQAYFVRWMQRWPTLQLLALATEEEVTSVWAGLGYYRRARFLLQGAQFAAAHNTDGGLPATTAELLRVPGIGPYTAAAVASIAFGQQAAAVDGAYSLASVQRATEPVLRRQCGARSVSPPRAAAARAHTCSRCERDAGQG